MPIKSKPFRLTIVHPCVGRRIGMKRYIRTWQMAPLPAAAIAAMAGDEVDMRFYDDRLEAIPYDEPTDLVAISVETYTARRAYQIASAYRQYGVPVVMGGFRATLCPDEVSDYCESIVIGEGEDLFPRVIDDYRHGSPEKIYRSTARPARMITPDRSIFRKRSAAVALVDSMVMVMLCGHEATAILGAAVASVDPPAAGQRAGREGVLPAQASGAVDVLQMATSAA